MRCCGFLVVMSLISFVTAHRRPFEKEERKNLMMFIRNSFKTHKTTDNKINSRSNFDKTPHAPSSSEIEIIVDNVLNKMQENATNSSNGDDELSESLKNEEQTKSKFSVPAIEAFFQDSNGDDELSNFLKNEKQTISKFPGPVTEAFFQDSNEDDELSNFLKDEIKTISKFPGPATEAFNQDSNGDDELSNFLKYKMKSINKSPDPATEALFQDRQKLPRGFGYEN